MYYCMSKTILTVQFSNFYVQLLSSYSYLFLLIVICYYLKVYYTNKCRFQRNMY